MKTPLRGRPRLIVAAFALAAVVLVVFAADVVHNFFSGHSNDHTVTELKMFARKVPLPLGATLTDETSNEAHGDVNSFLQRDYRLDGAVMSSAQIKAALTRGHCRLIDLRAGKASAIDKLWSEQTGPNFGDIYVLPPGTEGGGIELNWQGATLVLRLSGGDVENTR